MYLYICVFLIYPTFVGSECNKVIVIVIVANQGLKFVNSYQSDSVRSLDVSKTFTVSVICLVIDTKYFILCIYHFNDTFFHSVLSVQFNIGHLFETCLKYESILAGYLINYLYEVIHYKSTGLTHRCFIVFVNLKSVGNR